jgi:predicted lipid-binding transport protein (Tim44 family)
MKVVLVIALFSVAAIFLFKRYYRSAPGNFKGWLGRLVAILAIGAWIYLLFRIR